MTVLQGLAIQFGTLGFNGSVVYFISRDKERVSQVVSVAIGVASTAGIVAAALLAVAARVAPGAILGSVDIRYLDMFLVAIPCGFFQQFLQNVLLARQRIAEYNLLDLAVRTLQLAAFGIVLIAFKGSTMDAVMCIVGATIVSAGLYVIRTWKYVKLPYRFDVPLFSSMVQYGTRTYASSLMMFLAMRMNLIIVNSLLGEAHSGTYSVVFQIADLVYLVPITLGTLLFPRVSSRSLEETDLTTKTMRLSFVAMGVVGLTLGAFSKSLVLTLYGAQFVDAIAALRWYMPGMVALSLVMILNNDLAGRGLPRIVIWAPMVGIVVNGTVTMSLVWRLGISGAAIASSLGYVSILALLIAHYIRIYNVSLRHLLLPRRSDFNMKEMFK